MSVRQAGKQAGRQAGRQTRGMSVNHSRADDDEEFATKQWMAWRAPQGGSSRRRDSGINCEFVPRIMVLALQDGA